MVKKALLGDVGDAELRLLRIFKAVVQCGGLSAAELELNIGRSTVSRHVRDLEARLGLILCRRGRAGFALTADGQRVYESSLRLIEAMDSFRTDVNGLHADLAGNLAVGIFDKTVTNPKSQIARAVRDFRRLAPDVTLDISVGSISNLEAGVIDGRLHLGIVPGHRRSESLEYVELFDETMYLYCGRQHPLFGADPQTLTWSDIQDYDYAGLAFHSPNMEVTHRFGLRRHATVTDQEAIATLVFSGCYLGFLPDHYAATFVRDGLIQRVPHAQCMYTVQFLAVTRHAHKGSRAAQAFRDVLMRAHAENLEGPGAGG
jgi:DNA-binding transcriptional LysR family regulator